MTEDHPVVSHDQWLEARRALLEREKEFDRQRDELSAARRALPREEVTKRYVFEGAHGRRDLGELFDGRSQLLVYHFLNGAYHWLDLAPQGRDEGAGGSNPQAWVRRHDEYGR